MLDSNNVPIATGPAVVMLKVGTQQSTNISVGDHLKIDTIQVNLGKNIIIPDVSSTYTTATGASIGRIQLAPGYVYKLYVNMHYINFTSSAGQLDYAFFDVLSQTQISTKAVVVPATDTNGEIGSMTLQTIYAPTSPSLVEIQFFITNNINFLGSSGNDDPTIIIEVLH